MAGLSGGDWERRWIPRLTSCPFSRPHCLRHRPAPPAGAGACISLHRHPHCPATPIHPHHFIPPTPLSPLCSPLSGTLPSRTCLLLPASRRPSHALSAFTFTLFLSPRLFGATPSSLLLYAGGNLASAPLSLPVYHGPVMFRSTLPVHCPPSVRPPSHFPRHCLLTLLTFSPSPHSSCSPAFCPPSSLSSYPWRCRLVLPLSSRHRLVVAAIAIPSFSPTHLSRVQRATHTARVISLPLHQRCHLCRSLTTLIAILIASSVLRRPSRLIATTWEQRIFLSRSRHTLSPTLPFPPTRDNSQHHLPFLPALALPLAVTVYIPPPSSPSGCSVAHLPLSGT